MINENKNKNENLTNIDTDPSNTEEFNFDSYFEIFPERRSEEHYKFLCWFVGFSEGNATISTIKRKDCPNAYSTRFQIKSTDLESLKYIQKELNLGALYKITQSSYYAIYIYQIADKESINKLMQIFNGNVTLNKTVKKIQIWHKTSAKSRKLNTQTILLPKQNKISLNNGWFSGFADADCGFTACLFKCKTNKSGFGLKLIFKLAQQNEKEVLNKIKILFKSEGKILDLRNDNFILQLQSKSSFDILIKYLERFPFKTENKILSFTNWKKLLKYGYQENLYPIVQDEEKFLNLKKQIKEINEHSIKSSYYNKNLNKEE